jgi:Ca-activated chloride channel family protein
MRVETGLSTRFVTAQNAHRVGLLVTVEGEHPPERPPINVSLVLDRSGSMAGEPLQAAREAALRFLGFLGPSDRVSVVTFDDAVRTEFGPGAGNDPAAREAVQRIRDRGTTNLSGGWLQGRTHVAERLVTGTNRVVLLTDGLANQGITDQHQLEQLSRGAAEAGVSTTCIGFGSGFNEDLLRAMGEAGRGNFWYVEHVDQMGEVFSGEIEGLVALAAQNVTVDLRLLHDAVAGVMFYQRLSIETPEPNHWVVRLGDLDATSPRVLGLTLFVNDLDELGTVRVAEVRVSADVLTAEGIDHRVITTPVTVNLDGSDHVEPTVERTLVRFQAAKAREEAIARADRGDLDGAAQVLRVAQKSLAPYAADAEVTDEMADLATEAARLAERDYDAAVDRKYHMARAMAESNVRMDYKRRIARRRPPKPGPAGGPPAQP